MKYFVNETQYNKIRKSISTIDKKNIHEQDSPELSKKQQKLIGLIEKLQKGIISYNDLEDYIGGLDVLINKLADENLLHYINPFDKVWQDYENEIFYALYENDSKFIWKIVEKYFSDIEKKGNLYYFKADPDDLSLFFRDDWRNDVSRDAIESIISGEHDYDVYTRDVTDNVYRDVYDELKPENQIKVNQSLKDELSTIKEIEIKRRVPELFLEIAKEQNQENKINLTPEIIERLLKDNDSIEYIINNITDEVNRDLYSLYDGCYNGVLQSSWYNDIMNELVDYVIDDPKGLSYTYQRRTYDKEGNPVPKTIYSTMYDATNCIYEVVSEFLTSNKDSTYTDNCISYFGSYKEILKNLIETGDRSEISSPRLDDWPDSSKVERCINENVGDYF